MRGIGFLGAGLYLSVLSMFSYGADINVVGLFSDKALVEIDGGKARVLHAGQTTPEGIKLISANSDGAVFEIEGKRTAVQLGRSIGSHSTGGKKPMVTLVADISGHFVTPGSINGANTRFLVDTGATSVVMSVIEARRLGIQYLHGVAGYASTAGGNVAAYRVVLNSVQVGDITLNQVDGVVLEGPGMPVALLGMSFLQRVEMKREGSTMTLIKQY